MVSSSISNPQKLCRVQNYNSRHRTGRLELWGARKLPRDQYLAIQILGELRQLPQGLNQALQRPGRVENALKTHVDPSTDQGGSKVPFET